MATRNPFMCAWVGVRSYMAQISMTSDGGATWTSVFTDNGNFYFNGILSGVVGCFLLLLWVMMMGVWQHANFLPHS
jgi:hypothetical protein